jgi:tRNA 5-methylaminomethyl-2-thiouridine biosynthesis bifunctional protein
VRNFMRACTWRRVVWAGLLGEALADLMTAQPLPLETELMWAIAPARFTRR